MGRNVDRGRAVKFCICTDLHDELVSYGGIRRVLCHELSHNVWGDHDDNVSIGSRTARISPLTISLG